MSAADSPHIPAPTRPTPAEEELLAAVVWRAIEESVGLPRRPTGYEYRGGLLDETVGVFVSVYVGSQLRGCFGSVRPGEKLIDAVGSAAAAAAAAAGSRFPPLVAAELETARVEIACLGELAQLPQEVVLRRFRPGEHGLCLEQGDKQGLLLPDVAARCGWDAVDFLDAVAESAGLPAAAWQEPSSGLFVFRVCSFDAPRPPLPLHSSGPDTRRVAGDVPQSVPAPPAAGVLARLREARLLPRHRLGQHFLHDPKLLEALVRDAVVGAEDAVFEVGTGPATLTRVLAEHAAQVLTVEVDPRMMAFARHELSGCSNVTFLQRDVLDGAGKVDAEVEAHLRLHQPFVWVSNLPYQVATRLVVRVCEQGLRWSRASLLVQHEVALRLTASPGESAYGVSTALLSFWVRRRTRGRRIPAGSFWPVPRVDGSLIQLSEVAAFAPPEEYPAYAACVRRLFAGRRKQLRRLLREILGSECVERALELGGWDPRTRPENLGPEDFLKLSREFPSLFLDSAS